MNKLCKTYSSKKCEINYFGQDLDPDPDPGGFEKSDAVSGSVTLVFIAIYFHSCVGT
jgi:hypothetical protein